MKKCLFTVALGFVIVHVHAQDLQTVTTNGNKTTNRIVLGTTDDGISKFQITGGVSINSGLSNTSIRPAIVNGTSSDIRGRSNTSYYADDGFLRLSAGGGTNIIAKTFIDLSGYSTVPDMDGNITFGTVGAERMRITNLGYVGIGTKTPKEALSVNGNIRSRQIKVETDNWPDYVFEPEYNLPSLVEVNTYITNNHHLAEMPSAQEVARNGVNLGEIVKVQTKKLEELTLYLIEKDKQVNNLQNEIIQLKQQMNIIIKTMAKN